MPVEFSIIRGLVGKISKEDLRYVDFFASPVAVLFMPVGGACLYARAPLHSHPSYMFIIHYNDETSLRIHGKTIKGIPGKVFALPPGVPHHELPSDSPPRYLAVFIEKDFFDRHLSCYSIRKDIASCGEFFDQPAQLIPALKRFMIEADGKNEGSEAVLEAIGTEICHILIRGILNRQLPEDRISPRVEIDRAVELMHSNIDKKITITDLSIAARMSATHFMRVFKGETGSSPMEYLNRIRLERAKKLLTAGDKSVTEIAFECGFSSPSYLCARFRGFYGASPLEYAKAVNKGAISKKNGRKAKD